jgi:hypothetical protein
MTTTARTVTGVLHGLAMWVAERLDAGGDESALQATRAVEHWVDGVWTRDRLPTTPVMGRRSVRTHQRMVEQRRHADAVPPVNVLARLTR